jgi:hypothetical protein
LRSAPTFRPDATLIKEDDDAQDVIELGSGAGS